MPPLVPSSIPCRAAEGRDQPSARRISSLGPVIEGGQPVPSLGEDRTFNLGTPRRHKPGSMGALRGEECNLRNHRRPSGHVCLSRRAFDDIMRASAWSTRYENRQTPQQSNDNRLILLPNRQAISAVGPHYPCSWLGPAACAASFFLEG